MLQIFAHLNLNFQYKYVDVRLMMYRNEIFSHRSKFANKHRSFPHPVLDLVFSMEKKNGYSANRFPHDVSNHTSYGCNRRMKPYVVWFCFHHRFLRRNKDVFLVRAFQRPSIKLFVFVTILSTYAVNCFRVLCEISLL